jgi:RpiR family carbohydrate utilization transcriptional regulator
VPWASDFVVKLQKCFNVVKFLRICSMPLLKTIQDQIGSLRKSEAKVADYVLKNASQVIRLPITDLAKTTSVSEPTVIRFCRAVGCTGFQDLKMTLAQELASAPLFGQVSVDLTDTTEEFSLKVFDSTIDTLRTIKEQLDTKNITRAVNAMATAKRVEFFGFGASGSVAIDAHHKFIRLQLATAAYTDLHIQSISASTMSEGDVMVAISQSGRTSALLHSISLVKKTGGTVIAIAPSHSPIVEQADISIEVNVEENIDIYTPLSSRIVHLVIIDVLAIGVAQRRGPALKEHLLKLKQGLKNLRL